MIVKSMLRKAGHLSSVSVDRGPVSPLCLLSFSKWENTGNLKLGLIFTAGFRDTTNYSSSILTWRGNRINKPLYSHDALQLKVLPCILYQVKNFYPVCDWRLNCTGNYHFLRFKRVRRLHWVFWKTINPQQSGKK